jgi:low temperature requirement protein LtrA
VSATDRHPSAARYLRPRDGEPQETTSIELFFDLIYVLAITQLSQLMLSDLSWTSVWHMTFLLLVVWWAWISATWTLNWLDPTSSPVRLLVVAAGLASLLMAAALPTAFGGDGVVFAASYVGLQVGRNLGATLLLHGRHPLGDTFARLLTWSVAAGVLWIAGAFLPGGSRIALWGPALAIELLGPIAMFWLPGRGRMGDAGYPVDGSHFAERCQGFIIIALGESIVVTGARAASDGLTAASVGALAIGFVETATLWWLYFGEVAIHSRRQMRDAGDPLELARDGYSYLHLLIVAGIIVSAVGIDDLVHHPGGTLDGAPAAVTLAGPAIFLLGEVCFRVRMIGVLNRKRVTAIVALAALGVVATAVPAFVLGLLVLALLIGLALWEYEPLRRRDTVALPEAD